MDIIKLLKKNIKSFSLGSLTAMLFVMGIAYATFSSQLKINATSTITSKWNIEIVSITPDKTATKTGDKYTVAGDITHSVDQTNKLSASFSTALIEPGDSVTYTIEVENKGNLDAVVSAVTPSTSDNEYITFVTNGIEENDTLNKGQTKKFTITVTYVDKASGQELPTNNQSSFKLILNFIQGDGTSGGSGEETGDTPSAESTIQKLNTSTVNIGDGLYQDSTEEGRYIYRGANPDNYICLGDLSSGTCPSDSLYRIISIESDGTMKVIKNTSIGNMSWDPGYSTVIDYNGTAITDLNNISGTRRQGANTASYFCRDMSTTNSSYYGCNAWGSATSTLNSNGEITSTMPHEVGGTAYTLPTYNSWLNVYLNGGTYHAETSTTSVTGWIDGSNGLNSTVKSKVLSIKTFNIGPVTIDSSVTDLSTSRIQEAEYKWKGKVGLMNITDYVSASTNSACTTLYKYFSDTNCNSKSNTHNWLYNSTEFTLSPKSSYFGTNIWIVTSSGNTIGFIDVGYTFFTYPVRPVFYLSSDINIIGSGTNDSAVYTIS